MALTPGDAAAAAARLATAETRLAGRSCAEHGPADDMWPPAAMMPKLHSFIARASAPHGDGGALLRDMPNLVLVAALHGAAPAAGAAGAAEVLFVRGVEGAEPLLARALPALRRAVRHWAPAAAPARDAGDGAGAAAGGGDVSASALHALLLRAVAAAGGGCRAGRAAAEVGAGLAAHIDTAAADEDDSGGGERALVTQPAFSGLGAPCTLPEQAAAASTRGASQRRSAEAVSALAALAAAPGGTECAGWREALHKLILLSFLERSTAAHTATAAPPPLPPLLTRLLGALRAARCTLSPEDAERCLAPLPDIIAADDPNTEPFAVAAAALVASLRAALSPLTDASARRHAWRPAAEYLPCGADDAFALRALLLRPTAHDGATDGAGPSSVRRAAHDAHEPFALRQLALRLQLRPRHAHAEAMLAVALALSQARPATDLLRDIFASAAAAASTAASTSAAAVPPLPTDDDAWRLSVAALVATVARDGSCARTDGDAVADENADMETGDADADAAAAVLDLTDVTALRAAALRAAARAAAPAASALRAVAEDAAAAARGAAGAAGATREAARVTFLRHLLLRALSAPQPAQLNAALFEACVALTPPPSPPLPLLSASAFASAATAAPRHWPALLPLTFDATAALGAWAAAAGGAGDGAAHATAARAAHAACIADATGTDASELLLHALTPLDADAGAGGPAFAAFFAACTPASGGGEAAALLTWLLATHAARLAADAALLSPRAASQRRLARLDALAAAAGSARGVAVAAAVQALRCAVALARADAAWCANLRRVAPPPAHADANAGAKRRRRLQDWCTEEDATRADDNDDDVLTLQTAPLAQLLGGADADAAADGFDACGAAAALASALAGCACGRAAALHVASRALLCGGGADASSLARALAAALDAHGATRGGGAGAEARAARRLCAHALGTAAAAGDAGGGSECWAMA
jgi:hypothetical protein